MCSYSAIMQYGQTLWPNSPNLVPAYPPPLSQFPAPLPTAEEWAQFRKLLAQAAEFDKAARQPDCEDPEKVAWMKRIEERLARLETQPERTPT